MTLDEANRARHGAPVAAESGVAASQSPPSLVDRVIRRWWLIALGVVLGVLAAYASVALTQPSYRSRASVVLSDVAASISGAGSHSGDPRRNAATQQSVLLSTAVANAAATALGHAPSVQVSSSGDDVLVVAAEAPNAVRASQDANAWVDAYFKVTESQLRDQLQPIQNSTNARLSAIETEITQIAANEATLRQQAINGRGTIDAAAEGALQGRRDALFAERTTLQEQNSHIGSFLLLGNPYSQRLSTAIPTDAQKLPILGTRLLLGAIAGGAVGFALALLPLRRTRRHR